ncbi:MULTISPECIES: heavy-metal-associated domain-containing protein [unclassified Acidovorax]|jgi:copper chaperone|uniref:heavy-metal-associated domain-containing protein n=1 Tax=unclassified Acidovorax TaxID=2684926 RepID=UPI00070BBA6A|nr:MULTISPECIES: heavy-metal-associated domain-containing protein [unclassified Acidovorax]KRC26309.1 heavy metal transporter [Acidovorax sp. Root219]MDZ7863921.1 heavy-metal-associated domain-containing protein [Acidovorax sp.]
MHEFQLPDMTCGHCAGMVSQTLQMTDPGCKIQVDMPKRTVTVQSTEDRQTLAEALTEAGYPPA